MTPRDTGGKHRASSTSRLWVELRVVGMVLRRELLKFWRGKTKIASGFAQPLLFLLIFGFGIQSIVDQADDVDFAAFVFPGVIAMTVLGRAFTSAVSVVYDEQQGFLREMLAAPASRAAVVVGSILGGAVTATLQAGLLFAAAPLMGVWPSPLAVLGALGALFLMSAHITALGVAVATYVRTPQTFQAFTQTLTYPILVLSGALFPLTGLPQWIQTIGKVNTFSYPVDSLRRLLLEIGPGSPMAKMTGIKLFGHSLSVAEEILLATGLTALLVAIASRGFGRVR